MAEARAENAWDHTASLMAMLHNVNVADEDDCVGPEHYHPLRESEDSPEEVDGSMPLTADVLHDVVKPMVEEGQI